MSQSTEQAKQEHGLSEDEKAFRVYELWTRLLSEENRLLSERTNIFLLASSILFTGFVFLFGKCQDLGYVIAVIGILFCVSHFFNAASVCRAIGFSMVSAFTLEEDEPAFESFRKKDLVHVSASHKYWFGKGTKQEQRQVNCKPLLPERLPLRHGGWIPRACFRHMGPAAISATYIPGLFLGLWVAGLIAL